MSNSRGCKDTIVKSVTIDSLPVASFFTDTVCKGNATHFYDNSQSHGSNNISWLWNFGDGLTNNIHNPSHTYLNSTQYNVTLIVSNQFGCKDTVLSSVKIDSLPDANFSSINVPYGSPMPFTDLSVSHGSPVIGWQWYFGDGTTSIAQHPVHLYPSASTYSVMLIAQDAKGCIDTVIHNVTVYPLPLPNFNANAVCFGDSTHFTDVSTPSGSPISNWLWNFGDGSSSSLHNPVHLYNNPGTYLVKLIVVDSHGSSDSVFKNVVINSLPISNFTSTVSCFNTPTQFNNTSNAINSTITLNTWLFGDGGSSTSSNPTHFYTPTSSIINYNVKLTVTDANGCKSSATHNQTVYPEVFAEFISDTVCTSFPVQLMEQSHSISGTIVNWHWDFGNGDVNNSQYPVYSYPLVVSPVYYPVKLVVLDNHGCSDTITHNLYLKPLPHVDFSADSVCFGSTTHFSSNAYSAGGTITNYHWSFDGASSSLSNPTHVFSNWGSSNATLTVTDINGCINTISKQVFVDSLPIANFTESNTCFSTQINFTDLSIGNGSPIFSWYWNFGNSNYSSLQNPSYYYTTADTFNVTLTVKNTKGCSNSQTHSITINPNSSFAFTADTVCFGEQTSFQTLFTNPNITIVSSYWDFGDGASAVLNNPTHQFALPGNYHVSLTVLFSNGCSETIFKIVKVNALPLASFSVSDACLGSVSTFTDAIYGTGNNNISRYWIFGDGQSINGGTNQNHTYLAPGSYTSSLIVTNSFGCKDTANSIVHIQAKPNPDFSFTDACLGTSTLFTDNTISNNSMITSWEWNFGDGNIFNIPCPVLYTQYINHQYNSPGTYWVKLVISNSLCSDTAAVSVTIDSIPHAHFTNTTACYQDSTHFTEQSIMSSHPIVSWLWTFGDGYTSTAKNPVHLYNFPGSYLVSLTVFDVEGCKDSVQQWILVRTNPATDFTYSISAAGSPSVFSDISIPNGGNISGWNWNFGDSTTSALQNPIKTYFLPGIYNVTLTITNVWGCKDSSSYTVVVNSPIITAGFSYSTGCEGALTSFTDTSHVGYGSIVQWNWDFGDGFTSTIQNPTHTYISSGDYIVRLIAISNFNNSDTIYQSVPVFPLPISSFTFSTPCVGTSMNFMNNSTISSGNIAGDTWIFGDGFSYNSYNTSRTFLDTGLISVTLVIHSDKGCLDTISQAIKINSIPEVHINSDMTNGCSPLLVNFSDSSIVTNGTITSWAWNFGDGNTSNSQHSSYHIYKDPGIYSVSLWVYSDNGCFNSMTVNNLVTVYQKPTAAFSTSPNTVSDNDGNVWFSNLSTGATLWQWDFNDGMSSILESPAILYKIPGKKLISLIVSNEFGCKDTVSHEFLVTHEDEFFIPNAFSPNNDNLNSYFGPYGENLEAKHFKMHIWNRWGDLVYSTTSPNNLWAGKDLKDTDCPIGTYIYQIFLDDKNGLSKIYKGQVTLIR